MPSYDFIRITDVNQVRWLEFDRGPVNAFNRQMVHETRDGIAAALEDPSVRVLVLASAVEGYFSAGADLAGVVEIVTEFLAGVVDKCLALFVDDCADFASFAVDADDA